MIYVEDQNSEQLRAHMKRLVRIPGWNDPLSTRLWKEIQDLDKTIEGLSSENISLQNLNKDLHEWVEKLKERISYMMAHPQNFEREWKGLTSPERINIAYEANGDEVLAVQMTEAKLRSKNT